VCPQRGYWDSAFSLFVFWLPWSEQTKQTLPSASCMIFWPWT
jgi:hypothetical protein